MRYSPLCTTLRPDCIALANLVDSRYNLVQRQELRAFPLQQCAGQALKRAALHRLEHWGLEWIVGVTTVADRALQRSVSQALSAIYEQDFLSCSFGGRPGRGAHQALATLHERIAGGKIEWVLEADLKNFFGSLSHEWMLRFVEYRVGDQRLISLIPRWLKAAYWRKAKSILAKRERRREARSAYC